MQAVGVTTWTLLSKPHNLGPDGNQVRKRWREGQGEEKGEREAGDKGYKGMREIGKGCVGEEKVDGKKGNSSSILQYNHLGDGMEGTLIKLAD